MSFKIEYHKELTQVTTEQDSAIGIMKWGRVNAFPQTLVNLIEQSPSAKPCVERTAKFFKGSQFENEDEICSPYGLTLKQLVSIIAEDYSRFKAFAIHCNYSIEGQIVGMSPIRITDLRFNEFDELNFSSKIGYHQNFSQNSAVKKNINQSVTRGSIKWFDRFNPNAVQEQIKRLGKGDTEIQLLTTGIQNYNGQILYHSDSGLSSYPIPPLQAPVNYVLADVENSILMRKESSTGFIDTYFLKTTLPSDDSDLIALENAIDGAQGARGTGKIITMSGMAPEDLNATVLEKIDVGSNSGGTIDSITKSVDLCQRIIQGAYLIPPILAGNSADTGFSEPDLRDAYFVFNSVTQEGRDTIESNVNRILKNSIFNVKEIDLQKLTLDTDEDQEEDVIEQ